MPSLNPFNRSKALVVAEPSNINAALIKRWLHDKAAHTQVAYTRDITLFLTFTGDKPLQCVTLDDLQGFADTLLYLAPASQARILKACKSLLTFSVKATPGLFDFNAGAALKAPKSKNTLAERILDEEQVKRIIAGEMDPRNHLMLLLLYNAGLRREELCSLCWRDVQPSRNKDGVPTGQITVFGKGGRTRAILLHPNVYQALAAYRQGAPDETPLFDIGPDRVAKLVKRAAKRVGIEKPVSPHWFRHAHASHALDNGAPISLVQQTLGHASVQTTGKYLHARPDTGSGDFLPL